MHERLQEAVNTATAISAADATTKAAAAREVRVASSLADLKAMTPTATGLVLLMGKTASSDGLGGTYYWDSASAEAEDATYLNVVVSTALGVTAGRWRRIIAKTTVLPQGTLVVSGGVKTLYATATVVGSAGQATLNLTTDNTATGPAIFSEIWANLSDVKPPITVTVIEDTPACSVQSETTKQTVHVATRGNKTTLGSTLLALTGLVITSLRYAPAGTVLRITVTGI